MLASLVSYVGITACQCSKYSTVGSTALLHRGDDTGVNGKTVPKSYPWHWPFSCGLFYWNITVLFTLASVFSN